MTSVARSRRTDLNMFDYYFLWILVTAPSQKGRLPHLLVLRPFRERHFAHQPWLNSLNFLWDFWRLFDRRFMNKIKSGFSRSIASFNPFSLKPVPERDRRSDESS